MTNDPIRYEAGDVNLYRFVGNSPGMGVDPWGMAVYEAKDAPKNVVFDDEVMLRSYLNNRDVADKIGDTKKTMQILLKLSKLADQPGKNVTVRVRYITNIDTPDMPNQFAKDVSKKHFDNTGCEPGSINLYIGHGVGNGKRADYKSVEGVGKIFKNTDEWHVEKNKFGGLDLRADQPPFVSFFCCYAGSYNGQVPRSDGDNTNAYIEGSITEAGTVFRRTELLTAAKLFAEIDKRIAAADSKNTPLFINLYFGEEKGDEGDRSIEATAKMYGKTPLYRFAQWNTLVK